MKKRSKPTAAPRTKAEALARVAALERRARALVRKFADATRRAEEAERESEERRRALADAQEREGATADILRIIGQSPTDAQPVFDAIVRSAVRLCGGRFGGVFRIRDDGQLHVIATESFSPEALEVFARTYPRAADRLNIAGRALLERRVVHLPDVFADAEATSSHELARAAGYRALVSVPMFRDGELPVLIVEDDAPLRELLRRMLEREGYAVVEAEQGRVALDRVREGAPGVILLDLMMPVMDGFEFLGELRRAEVWRGIPVIVLTARDLSAEERERLNGSVARILQKGAYDQGALLAEVRALVGASVGPRRSARDAQA